MTGCFPTRIGTMHMRTKAVPPPDVRLFTEYFREAGYYVTNNSFNDFQVATPGSAFAAHILTDYGLSMMNCRRRSVASSQAMSFETM
jgi:hypothetical protein